MQKSSKVLSAVVGLGFVLCLSGCPNPNTYGTPRTTPSGKVSHSLAAEVIGAAGGNASAVFPTAPTYTLRIGASDNVDVGVRVANMTTLGADAKINFVKGGFDVAVDPGLQVFYFSASSTDSSGSSSASTSIAGTYLHLPFLFGANLSETITLVPTAGIMYGILGGGSSVTNADGSDSVRASANTGIIGRIGFGTNIRLNPGFAMHPELTVMKGFREGASGVLYLFGFGFNFGKLPEFTDVK